MEPVPQPQNLTWPTRIFVISLLLLAIGLLIHPLGDPDVYIHLRDGRFWVENHFQVDKEPFGYTIPDKPLERVEVLFRAGIYLTYQLGGYNLLIILKAIAMTAALFFLGRLIYSRWRNLGLTALLLGLTVLAPMNRIMPERPYVITYLLLPFILILLDQYRNARAEQTQASARRLWIIPLLTIPWANCHPGFVVIFGFLGAQFLDDLFHYWRTRQPQFRKRLLHIGMISSVTLLAGALNPIGFSIYHFVITTTSSHDFMKFLTEWAPPKFAQEPFFFFILGAVWFSQLAAIRKTRLVDLIPMAAFSYLAIKSYRNMPLFLIAAMPPLAANLRFLWQRMFPMQKLSGIFRNRALLAGSALVIILLGVAALTGRAFRFGEMTHMYPARGLDWLLKHPIQGRLLTHDIWGGYTGWMTHGRIQIFIDGRFPSFGEKLYSDYRKMIWGDPRHCIPLLDHHNIQGILISPKNDIKLYQALWKSGKWALVYWDDNCLLYVRKDPQNDSLLKFFQYYAIDPKKSPYFNPARPVLALQEAKRAAEITSQAFLPRFFMGELYLKTNDPKLAEQAFQAVIDRAPNHSGAWYNLGVLALQNKQYQNAEQMFRKALKHFPRGRNKMFARTAYMLAETIKSDPHRRREAYQWAQKALKAWPAWMDAIQLIHELK
ncbi:tetratricopeptide repeat protein [bacterium]|nr:tetratricopeptide repeat protein [bacterium]